MPTLDPPGRRTVHLSKSITEIKIVQNNISDNFYFDVNNVQPKLKEVIFYFFKNNGKSSFYRYKKFSQKLILDMLFYEASATDGKKISYPFFSSQKAIFTHLFGKIYMEIEFSPNIGNKPY